MTRVLMFNNKTRCVSFRQIVQYDSTTEHSISPRNSCPLVSYYS